MRDRTGEPPMRYYRKVRLQAARNALFYSESPIQDIGLSCGFSSPEVFSRTFRMHFGMSPREFRQKFAREELSRYRPELELQLGPLPRTSGRGSVGSRLRADG
jgi:AraC-like DNA-binding protein